MQPTPIPPQTWYPPPQQYYAYAASYYEAQRREQIDRTNTGLLLIAIGFFIGWVPFVGIVGGIIELIGAILVILGRMAFGPRHARNVIWSIIIWVIGIVVGVVAVFVAIFMAIANRGGGAPPPSFANSFAGDFFGAIAVGVAIASIAYILFIYELEQTNGRILLFLGYALNLVSYLVTYLLLSGNTLSVFGLVALAPGVVFGIAYLLARQRIVHGEIPGPPQPPHY